MDWDLKVYDKIFIFEFYDFKNFDWKKLFDEHFYVKGDDKGADLYCAVMFEKFLLKMRKTDKETNRHFITLHSW